MYLDMVKGTKFSFNFFFFFKSCLDLYHQCGDAANEAEGYRLHASFSQALLKDHFQSSQMSEHGVIQVCLKSPQKTKNKNKKILISFCQSLFVYIYV